MALTRIRVLNQQSTYNVDRLNANTLVVGGNSITGASGAGGGIVISSVVYLAANGTPLIANAAPTSGNSVIKIVGSGFAANANVFLNGLLQPSANVTFVDSTELRLNMPALASNTYSLYTFNAAGAGAIYYQGVRFDPYPIWTTGTYTTFSAPMSTQLLVTGYGSGSISFSVASGNTIPTGLTLAANGILSGTTTEGTYNFYVNATDSENEITTQQITLTVSFADPYFQYTTLLLSNSSQGSNGTNSFIDSSNNNFAVTASGTPYQGTFSPFPSTGTWSNYFNGSSGYLTIPSNSAFALGSSNFTIEFWMNIGSFPENSSRIYANATGVDWAANKWTLHCNHPDNVSKLSFWDYNYSSSSMLLAGTTTLSFNTWYHVAIVRNVNSFAMYLNGVLEATNTYSGSMDSGATISQIGGNVNAEWYHGHISNFRVIKGSANYTAAFTPSINPLTAVTNTVLLTCQSRFFSDNSTNNFTITKNGVVTVQRFNPFGSNGIPYSPLTNGGSIYFNGSTDYLSVADSVALRPGTGDFTYEFWWYPTDLTSLMEILSKGNGIQIYCNSGTMTVAISEYNSTTYFINNVTFGTPTLNAWNHIALVRSGNNYYAYVNGVRTTLGTTTQFPDTGSSALIIGGYQGGLYLTYGFLSNVRFVKGTALYGSENFTPSTTALVPITNTSLLTLGTNGRIIDTARQNNLRLFGDAKVSSSAIKYGTGSMYFDGTGDWIVSDSNNSNALGGGDLTVECWVNVPSISGGYASIVADSEYGNSNYGWAIYQNGSNLEVWALGQVLGASAVLTTNTWIHIAWTRSGSLNKLFINGTSVATATNSISYIGTRYWIGARGPGATSGLYPFTGYIDDLRITRGFARYTTTFTPPSGPPVLY